MPTHEHKVRTLRERDGERWGCRNGRVARVGDTRCFRHSGSLARMLLLRKSLLRVRPCSVACRACQRNRSGSRGTLFSFLLSITWPFLYPSLPYLIVNYSYARLLLFALAVTNLVILGYFVILYVRGGDLNICLPSSRSCTRDFGFTVLDIKGAR